MTILKTRVKCDNCGEEEEDNFEGWTGNLGSLHGLGMSGFVYGSLNAIREGERHYCPVCNQVVKDAQTALDAALKARRGRR